MSKLLTSTARTCDAGNTQVFTKDGGWIIPEKACGRIMQEIAKVVSKLKMQRQGNVYTYDFGVKKQKMNPIGAKTRNMNWEHENRFQAIAAVGDEEERNEVEERNQPFVRLGEELI